MAALILILRLASLVTCYMHLALLEGPSMNYVTLTIYAIALRPNANFIPLELLAALALS